MRGYKKTNLSIIESYERTQKFSVYTLKTIKGYISIHLGNNMNQETSISIFLGYKITQTSHLFIY